MTLWPVEMRWNARGQGDKNKKITRRKHYSTLCAERIGILIRLQAGNLREMRLVAARTARRARECSMPSSAPRREARYGQCRQMAPLPRLRAAGPCLIPRAGMMLWMMFVLVWMQ